ncbi:MAG: purine-nucleoside phosphorylase [Candidatus Actinomarinales bacterium]|nr:MAG: purine-nucleoside phosphorylase [Candidatus Actinomarinales bacterium]|tara:strand:- start:6539 stop:7363 length:825 start_codon:yes stop_codon:yes gene_type:complete
MYKKINETSKFINKFINNESIHSAIILGSGMSGFDDNFKPEFSIDYSEIPNFIKPSVEGHSGKLSIIEFGGKLTAVLSGRAHYYEGYDISEIVLPTRVLAHLGIKTLILTNAAGGIAENYLPGDIINIKDHINLTGNNPLIGKNIDELGPRFPDMTNTYDENLRDLAKDTANELFEYKDGVYAWFTGPTYETPSEVKFAKSIGADLVGMSTVPEAIVARHSGIKVSAFSLVTNLAAGISKEPLSHDEVIETANIAKNKLQSFMEQFLIKINLTN